MPSYKNKRVAVVVACYNEEPFIGHVINTMPALMESISVIGLDIQESQQLEVHDPFGGQARRPVRRMESETRNRE